MPEVFQVKNIERVVSDYNHGFLTLPEMQAIVLNMVLGTYLNGDDVLEIMHFIYTDL